MIENLQNISKILDFINFQTLNFFIKFLQKMSQNRKSSNIYTANKPTTNSRQSGIMAFFGGSKSNTKKSIDESVKEVDDLK